MFFLRMSPMRMLPSMSSGRAMILGLLSFWSMMPELTVKPFRPMTRLNSVARSRTCMVFGISSMLSSSSEK